MSQIQFPIISQQLTGQSTQSSNASPPLAYPIKKTTRERGFFLSRLHYQSMKGRRVSSISRLTPRKTPTTHCGHNTFEPPRGSSRDADRFQDRTTGRIEHARAPTNLRKPAASGGFPRESCSKAKHEPRAGAAASRDSVFRVASLIGQRQTRRH